MLFRRSELDAIAAGRLDLAYRRWRRPTVKAGGRLTTPAGVLAIDAVDPVEEEAIDDVTARRAGHDDRAALIAALEGRPGTLYRIAFHLAGPDPRIARRARAVCDAAELEAIALRLDRLDRASRRGPWTRAVLEQIAAAPGHPAAELAAATGRERLAWKRDVRKLKELSLTESLDVGYRLSPLGRSILDHLSATH